VVEITEISAVVAAAGVLVGVVYYILDMRNQSRMRQTDLVMRLYDRFSSNEFQVAWQKVRTSDVEKYSAHAISDHPKGAHALSDYPKELYFAVNKVCLFFEGVGILLRRRVTDTRMIEDLFGGTVIRAWESVKSAVEGARHQLNDPEIYYYFEYLYNEVKKREQRGVNGG
jgi:hypothetical protein